MEYRQHTIFTGQTFQVPTHIVRLDNRNTHGWQLRYGKSTLFSDHSSDGTGAAAALLAATNALARRIATLPAPTGLRKAAQGDKGNDMPLGISGPVARRRAAKAPLQYYLQVNFPTPGGKPANKSVYIATENTMTVAKYHAALAKAAALRESGVRKFKLATTKAKRAKLATPSLAAA